MLEVAVDFPDLPKGMEMDLGGLLVRNGETTKVDEDAELAYVSRNAKPLKEGNVSDHVKITGTAKYGPAAVEKMFPPVEPRVEPNPYVEEGSVKEEASTDTNAGGEQ